MIKGLATQKSLNIAICLSLGVAGAIAYSQSQTVHTVDGWCLSYDRGTVTFATDNPAANRPVPSFQVPSDAPTASILDPEAETGWDVRFNKWRSGAFVDRPSEGCDATVLDNGLVRFPPKTYDAGVAVDSCPGASFKDLLLPAASEPLANRVQITCDPELRVPNCRMVDRMPNGWEAEIFLPNTQIDRWRDASADARAYFDAYLTDCGANEDT